MSSCDAVHKRRQTLFLKKQAKGFIDLLEHNGASNSFTELLFQHF